MAKEKKQVREIESVELKDPNQVIKTRNGMVINKDNLTVDRYRALVTMSHKHDQYFNVKYKPNNQKHETVKMEA